MNERSVELTKEEFERVMEAAQEIIETLAYAQGREDGYKANRDELKVIRFPSRE